MCVHHPTGISGRVSVQDDAGRDDCTAFGYCIDGDYVEEECTPGQYFEPSIGIYNCEILNSCRIITINYLLSWMPTIGGCTM